MILDVIDIEAEFAQSDQMMEQLPDDTRERVSHREMENNNPAFAFHPDTAAILVVRRGLG
jgi:heat shock protein HspQ